MKAAEPTGDAARTALANISLGGNGMAGLWRDDPATPEGKYPIILRRDGTVLDTPYFVIALRDPCAPAAFTAYAERAAALGLDPAFVQAMYDLASEAERVRDAIGPGDPDAPRHRADDPRIIAWARSIRFKGNRV